MNTNNYINKYIKYKNKYLCLKGGTTEINVLFSCTTLNINGTFHKHYYSIINRIKKLYNDVKTINAYFIDPHLEKNNDNVEIINNIRELFSIELNIKEQEKNYLDAYLKITQNIFDIVIFAECVKFIMTLTDDPFILQYYCYRINNNDQIFKTHTNKNHIINSLNTINNFIDLLHKKTNYVLTFIQGNFQYIENDFSYTTLIYFHFVCVNLFYLYFDYSDDIGTYKKKLNINVDNKILYVNHNSILKIFKDSYNDNFLQQKYFFYDSDDTKFTLYVKYIIYTLFENNFIKKDFKNFSSLVSKMLKYILQIQNLNDVEKENEISINNLIPFITIG